MQTFNVGTNDDGTPHVLYHAPGEHVVLTPNQVGGEVTLPDGTAVDVSARCIVVDSQDQGMAVAAAIAEAHPELAEQGHETPDNSAFDTQGV